MTTIFAATIARILKPKAVILYLAVISSVSLAAGFLIKTLYNSSILQGQIITVTSLFITLSYVWIMGLPLVIWIIYHGTGLIAGERDKGTLLLLFSKPLSRNRIFLGKYLALITSTLLLGECSIFLAIILITTASFSANELTLCLLKTVPFLSIYLLFVTVCFSTISAGLSVFCRSRKKSLFGLTILVIILYIVLPVLRLELKPTVLNWLAYLSYLDLSIHLESLFYFLITSAEDIMLSPSIPLGKVSQVVVSPMIVSFSWLAVCLSVLILALKRINKMNII